MVYAADYVLYVILFIKYYISTFYPIFVTKQGYHRENEYIAVQGPTSRTVGDFWQMIWDQKPTMIVMVTKVEENGKVTHLTHTSLQYTTNAFV